MTLKTNSKKILDHVASGKNNTEAYLAVHPDAKRTTAGSNAWQLMQKPESQIYLKEHIDKAKETVVSLLNSDKDDIRLRASDSILDRELGKATQRMEVQTNKVSINIDLTGSQEPTGIE